MSSSRSESVLFSQAALAVLREARLDPNAKQQYEIMSGGFVWSDEGLFNDVHVSDIRPFRWLVGYRSSLIRGNPNEELRSPWDQLIRECSTWPGFQPERRDSSLARELDAEWRKVRRDCIAMEREYRKKTADAAIRRPWWQRLAPVFKKSPPTSPR